MAAKTVGFAIADEDREQLDALVEHYGNGNRSEFLRVAMTRLQRDMLAERMRSLQARARDELGGRVVTRDEVTALVLQTLRDHA
jgi:Arc/MetJ-type ribon-helix-helix transcriptional regulator